MEISHKMRLDKHSYLAISMDIRLFLVKISGNRRGYRYKYNKMSPITYKKSFYICREDNPQHTMITWMYHIKHHHTDLLVIIKLFPSGIKIKWNIIQELIGIVLQK